MSQGWQALAASVDRSRIFLSAFCLLSYAQLIQCLPERSLCVVQQVGLSWFYYFTGPWTLLGPPGTVLGPCLASTGLYECTVLPFHMPAIRFHQQQRRDAYALAGSSEEVEANYRGAAQSRFQDVCQTCQWTAMGAGAFQTRFGVYNFDADGEATVKNLLRRECILRLLKNDKRCNQLDTQRLLDSGYFPDFSAIHKWAAINSGIRYRIALGAAMDYRCVQGIVKHLLQKGERDKIIVDDTDDITCVCGTPLPSRQHFMWDCHMTELVSTIPRGPRCYLERSLGVPMVLQPVPAAVGGDDAIIIILCELLSKSTNSPILVATDGSSIEHGQYAAAGCGWATECGVASAQIGWASQTPGMAEFEALGLVVRAAANNLNVVRTANRILANTNYKCDWSFGLWKRLF